MRARLINGLLIAAVAAANLALWHALHRPVAEVEWHGPVRGIAFSPFQRAQDPFREDYPSGEEIAADLAIVARHTQRVRTYSATGGLERVAELAAPLGLRVTQGVWLDRRHEHNEVEVANAVRIALRQPNVERVIVGNETLLRGDLKPRELIRHIRAVRRVVKVPVSTAETWDMWLKHPELVREVDFLAVHVLPYWERVPAERAVDWVAARVADLRRAYPDKPVLLGEVGWPAYGERQGAAEPGRVHQARFLRRFANLAGQNGYEYFMLEAFDQPWKRRSEGHVGAHWGLYDADREAKVAFAGPIAPRGGWMWQAAAATLIAAAGLAFALRRAGHLRPAGRAWLAVCVQAVVSAAVWVMASPGEHALAWWEWGLYAVLMPALLLMLALVVAQALELAELRFGARRRVFHPADATGPLPKVSLHLAICNEPPAMVIATLDSVAALDYPDCEVIVVDNNTADPALWEPVRDHCARLGPRFRFIHLPSWPGFKAGALNVALRATAPNAEVIGVVDADYQVARDWLRRLVPHFARAEVAVVQAPQDNRDWRGDPFKTACNFEYAGFFHIGMVHRNERNAIIQHGTMTLIRRAALERARGWGEWCICEDAELGLRLMQAGEELVYVNQPFGYGLTPDTYTGYVRQRFRWAFGAVQILRRHAHALFVPAHGPLTAGQRYHFIAGWLPWLADAAHVVFALGAIVWSLVLFAGPGWAAFPLTALLLPVFAVLAIRAALSLYLYRRLVPGNWREHLGAALAGAALTHTVGRAVLQALRGRESPFLRTPKCESKPAWVRAALMARDEVVVLAALAASGTLVLWRYGAGDVAVRVWLALLAALALPYAAAVSLSLLNAWPAAGAASEMQPGVVAAEGGEG